MFAGIKKFFLELQRKDEAAKKWWLIALTSASMLIVIVFWGLYLNSSIENLTQEKPEGQTSQFTIVFKNGIKEIAKIGGERLSKTMEKLKKLIAKTNSVTVQNTDIRFTVKNLEPIEPKKLP